MTTCLKCVRNVAFRNLLNQFEVLQTGSDMSMLQGRTCCKTLLKANFAARAFKLILKQVFLQFLPIVLLLYFICKCTENDYEYQLTYQREFCQLPPRYYRYHIFSFSVVISIIHVNGEVELPLTWVPNHCPIESRHVTLKKYQSPKFRVTTSES